MLSQPRGIIESRRSFEYRLKRNGRLPLRHIALLVFPLLLALVLHVPSVAAQGLDPADLLKPPTDTWPTYNGSYSGSRFSTLDQINAGNVASISLAWVFLPHSPTIKSTPWK